MNQRGFSLAELLVSLAVLGLILAGIFSLQQQGQNAYLTGAARVEAQQNARLALDLMTRELRAAGDPAGAAGPPITAVGAGCNNLATGTNDITFGTWDVPTAAWVVARYRLNGTDLERTYNGVTTVLIGGVLRLRIVCYTGDGTTMTNVAANVRSLLISIQTRPEDVTASYGPAKQTIAAESRIRLRNVI